MVKSYFLMKTGQKQVLFSRSARKALGGGGGLKWIGRVTANKQNKFYGRPYTGLQDLHVYLNF